MKQELPTRVGSVIRWDTWDKGDEAGWKHKRTGVAARQPSGLWAISGLKVEHSDEGLLELMKRHGASHFNLQTSWNAYATEQGRARAANKRVRIYEYALRLLLSRWVELANIAAWQQREGVKHNWLNKNNEKNYPQLFPPAEMWSPGRGWIAGELERYAYDLARADIERWAKQEAEWKARQEKKA